MQQILHFDFKGTKVGFLLVAALIRALIID